MSNDLVARTAAEMGLSVDLSGLVEIEAMRRDINTVDIASAPMLMRDFTTACDLLSKAIHSVKLALGKAEQTVTYEESKALIDRAPKFFAENKDGPKDSMALRQTYVPLDELYRKAVENKNALKALLQYLEDKRELYKMDHYTVKSTYDKMELPHGSSGGLASGGAIGSAERRTR